MAKKEQVPAIRFQGFADPWEQRKLGEVASSFEYGLNAAAKEFDGVNKYLRITDIDDVSREFREDDLTSPDTDLSAASNYQLHNGEILFARTGASVGKSFIYRESDGLVYFAGFLIRARIRPEHDAEFVFQNTLGLPYEKYIQVTSQRSGQPGVNAQEYAEYSFMVPSLAEQKSIGSFLHQIDTLITLHQRKYDKLVAIKRSMLEKMFPREGSRFPEIRFAGFTDPWEQRKLGETFDFLSNNTLSRAELSTETGPAMNVHYGDVLIKFGEYLDATKVTLPFIPSQQLVDKFKSSLLQDGDVIMADTAEDEAVGKCTEIAGLQGFPTISGLHTIPLRPMRSFAPGYLGYYMNSDAYHDQLLPLMQGIKVTSVSKSAILNTDILYPADSDEQARIGRFFIQLDTLITLHQRKLEKLQAIKRSMLEKMFV